MSSGASSVPPASERSVETSDADAQLQRLCVQLFHLAPVGYLIHDPRGLVHDANPTAASMLGVPAHELRRQRLGDFAHHDDVARLTAHVSHAVLTGERCTLHVRLERPGGTRFSAVLESVSIDPPGPETRVLTTVLDETERVRTEARLLEREATLRCVLGAGRDAIVGVDEHGAIRAFEGTSEQIFGHRREQVLGQHVGMLFDVAAPPAARHWPPAPRARGRRADGATFPAEVTVHRVAGASYAVLCTRDLSREDELERALTEAQRVEIAGRLAAGVAHDTNNLLMRISSTADALLETHDPEVLRERVAELRRAAAGGASIVRRLASMIGPDLRGASEVDLDRAIEGLRTVLEPMMSGVALVLSLGAPDLRVRCHCGHVEQLVLNLAMNALDAMPAGGTLEISTSRGERPGGEHVRLEVRDTGTGMSDEVRARIFEPSFTTKALGTGLGLATVASIVERAGGSVDVTSVRGEGTTFRIELPAHGIPTLLASPARGAPASSLLLLVHDALVRSTLRAHLERDGHRVLEAADAREALERCRTYGGPIHALLLDGVPSGGPGAEIAARGRELRPEASVLFLSSRERAELVAGRLSTGVFLLQMPCSEEELRAALARALEPRASSPRRVLFVEDDALSRRSFGELLRRKGYEVVLASTIAEAVHRHRQARADVIVSDGKLPDGQVGDLLRELRGTADDAPVVVFSGLRPQDDRAIAAALGSSRTTFVQKPAGVDQLVAAFEELRGQR